jgi:hypothetical protein
MFPDNSQQPGNNQCGHDRLFWNGDLHCSDSGIRDPVRSSSRCTTRLWTRVEPIGPTPYWEKPASGSTLSRICLLFFGVCRVAQLGTAGRSPGNHLLKVHPHDFLSFDQPAAFRAGRVQAGSRFQTETKLSRSGATGTQHVEDSEPKSMLLAYQRK